MSLKNVFRLKKHTYTHENKYRDGYKLYYLKSEKSCNIIHNNSKINLVHHKAYKALYYVFINYFVYSVKL